MLKATYGWSWRCARQHQRPVVQDWQTPKEPGACYRVTMATQDGTSSAALFELRRQHLRRN